MKLPGWLTVYEHADPRTGTGYWFSTTPPSQGTGTTYRIEVEVPDVHKEAAVEVVTAEEQQRRERLARMQEDMRPMDLGPRTLEKKS